MIEQVYLLVNLYGTVRLYKINVLKVLRTLLSYCSGHQIAMKMALLNFAHTWRVLPNLVITNRMDHEEFE